MACDKREGLGARETVLLQTFMGMGMTVGTLGFGCVVVTKSKQCMISPQYLLQTAILGIGEYQQPIVLFEYLCHLSSNHLST